MSERFEAVLAVRVNGVYYSLARAERFFFDTRKGMEFYASSFLEWVKKLLKGIERIETAKIRSGQVFGISSDALTKILFGETPPLHPKMPKVESGQMLTEMLFQSEEVRFILLESVISGGLGSPSFFLSLEISGVPILLDHSDFGDTHFVVDTYFEYGLALFSETDKKNIVRPVVGFYIFDGLKPLTD